MPRWLSAVGDVFVAGGIIEAQPGPWSKMKKAVPSGDEDAARRLSASRMILTP